MDKANEIMDELGDLEKDAEDLISIVRKKEKSVANVETYGYWRGYADGLEKAKRVIKEMLEYE